MRENGDLRQKLYQENLKIIHRSREVTKMIKCDNCIHKKVCRIREFPSIKEILEDGCPHFKDKSPWVEVARKMSAEMEHEIAEALKSNYVALSEFEQADELYYRVKGKIDALRGIQDFLAEIEKKYIGE